MARNRIERFSTTDLIDELAKLADDYSPAAMLITEVGLEILEERMGEEEFVKLCESGILS